MQLAVIGVGHMGSVTAACLARRGHHVIGIDRDPERAAALNAGRSPVEDPELDLLVQEARERGLLEAVTDMREAVERSEIALVCVDTPPDPAGGLDLSRVREVSQEIAVAVRETGRPYHLVYRSTMLPGSSRMLWSEFFQPLGSTVSYWPEFLRQGSAISEFENPSLCAVGMFDPGQELGDIETIVTSGATVLSLEGAELLKIACNAFHSTKIAFANEIGRLAKSLSLDGAEVLDALCRDTESNISRRYLRPGAPFGGPCLPKDTAALHAFGISRGVALPLLAAVSSSNARHVDHLLSLIRARKPRRAAFLGTAFQDGSTDKRGSVALEVAGLLERDDVEVRLFDPAVGDGNAVSRGSVAEAVRGADVLIVFRRCAKIEELRDAISSHCHLFDTAGWPELKSLGGSYEGICW